MIRKRKVSFNKQVISTVKSVYNFFKHLTYKCLSVKFKFFISI